MRGDWKRRIVQRLFTGAMAMYKEGISDEQVPATVRDPQTLLQEMTLDEKISLLGGVDDLAIRSIPRLGIPKVWTSDATSGVRCFRGATAFPAALTLAATWDCALLYRVGKAIGEQSRALGVSAILGPGVNIARVPVCGRNFEYLGEDPFLAGQAAAAYIRGIQSQDVIAVVKHYACNNSEYDRHKSNSIVDARTLREIYLAPFEHAVVLGKAKGVMTAYNQINGIYASEHPELIEKVLREQWGFDGIVLSDWNSLYSTRNVMHAGVDLEMPKARRMTRKRIVPLLHTGEITEEMIDRKVLNILQTCHGMGIYQRRRMDPDSEAASDEHINLALEAAARGMILLKNEDQVLPLRKDSKTAVVGRCAADTPTGGGGSSYFPVDPDLPNIPDALLIEGIRVIEGDSVSQEQLRSADHIIVATGFDRMYESEGYDRPYELPKGEAELIRRVSAVNPSVIVILHAGGDVETASWIDHAKAVVFAGYLGAHRGIAAAQVLTGKATPSGKLPFTMGKKLNDHRSMNQYFQRPWEMSFLRILGPQGNPKWRRVRALEYSEGIWVGYRFFDAEGLDPQFPFGFGLSYTAFAIDEIQVDPKEISWEMIEASGKGLDGEPVVSLSCRIQNVGDFPGGEVLQVYVSDRSASVSRPEKELKGFEARYLQPGEKSRITIPLNARSFMFYHEENGCWECEAGDFDICVGTSSRDIIQRERVRISAGRVDTP